MADILKISTPLVNRSQNLDPKKNVDLNAQQFNLQDVTKVAKPGGQTELLKQNNGMVQQEDTSALLMNLLKDPSVTVNFLKNIFMLQEIIKLLPVNNKAFTQEIEQLFQQLMIPPEEIASEMENQEYTSTRFKGELFSFLREQIEQYPEQQELQNAVVRFLKAVNLITSKDDVLDAVANSLGFLSDSLAPSKGISGKLAELSARFREPDAGERFEALKSEVLELFGEVEDHILFSPKLAKVLSITVYNLSRYNDSTEHLEEALTQLLSQLNGEPAKQKLLQHFQRYISAADGEEAEAEKDSKIMEVLTKIIGRQTDSEELMLLNSEKVERIIHSLLSSPCNFTPLLHFVIPVQYENLQAFAEIWVNSNEDEDAGETRSGKRPVHMLLVFEISGIGQFEMELMVRDETIDLSLFCPPAFTKEYAEMAKTLPVCLDGLGYQFGKIQIEKLERPRSLMDVFRFLPHKRTGVDVKI